MRKIWEPFELGPELAMETTKGASWLRPLVTSAPSRKLYPGPSDPSPFCEPVWFMKPAMTRWKMIPL